MKYLKRNIIFDLYGYFCFCYCIDYRKYILLYIRDEIEKGFGDL